MKKVEFYPEATSKRINRLNEYYLNNIQMEERFVCSNYNACRNSHPGDFYEGQLSYVGKLYDSSLNENPFRIMIVGQEYGTKDRLVFLEKRSEMIFQSSELSFPQRNPHMRGTTGVLRLLWNGELGRDRESEILVIGNKTHHIFETFAMVNFLLCSALDPGQGKRGKATNEMKLNCSRHFRKSLEILEPTVIILQSKGFIKHFLSIFDSTKTINENLFIGMVDNKNIFLACFTHPSTPTKNENWGRNEKTSYLIDVVTPAIRYILNNYFIIF